MSLNYIIENNRYGVKIPTTKYNHGYLPVYERLFEPYKKHINLLEIGILGGSSLALWQEFFESYTITGVEILPDFMPLADVQAYDMPWIQNLFECPNINLLWNIDATQPVTDKVKSLGEFDIIIDDSVATIKLALEIFKNHWPLLKVGGTYIFEDLFRRHTIDAGKKIVNSILPKGSFQIDAIEIENQKRILFTVTKM